MVSCADHLIIRSLTLSSARLLVRSCTRTGTPTRLLSPVPHICPHPARTYSSSQHQQHRAFASNKTKYIRNKKPDPASHEILDRPSWAAGPKTAALRPDEIPDVPRVKDLPLPDSHFRKIFSRSSGHGGQSVNTADTRVQLVFSINAPWVPEHLREPFRALFKNQLSKNDEFTVACSQTSSQIENLVFAKDRVRSSLEKAEQCWEKSLRRVLDPVEWQIQQKIANGKEHEIEKREQFMKDQSKRNKDRSKGKFNKRDCS